MCGNGRTMNHTLADSPLLETTLTRDKMERWVKAQVKGERAGLDVYGSASEKQMKELENIRNLSKELQENLHELETSVRIADVENQALNPTAPIPDYSEDHEFVSANQLDNYYAEEDIQDAKEEERQRLTKGKAGRTDIQAFYKDQCVLLTGGTGFLGKVLIEKLLRSCGDIDTIFVLVRSKKGKDPRARIHEMLDDFLFQRAHEENPKGIYKVVPVVGDMELPGLGLSEEDRKNLTSKVTVIINAAATVKFDEKLPVATAINVRGTKEVIKLARECRNLRAITHVSTAFANTHVKFIEEKFYDPPMSVEALEAVAELDDTVLEGITSKLLGKYPNTYCFTKAVAESAVRKYGEGMPICIVRPAIVVSTYEEPVRGWTDSLYGPTGLMIGIGTGVLRTMYMDTSKVADLVPVDLTVNAILASAWHTAKHFKENQTSHIPIYNFVSGAQNPVTWGEFIEVNRKHGIDKPTTKAVWYYGLNPTSNYYMFLFYNFFLHYLPALIIDGYCRIVGRRRAMLKFYHKVMKLANILFYFSTQDWRFSDQSVRNMWDTLSEQDKAVFPFSIADMNWEYLAETFLVGLRVYLVKDDLSTLPEARKKWNRLYYMHLTLKLVTLGLVLNIAYYVLRFMSRIVFG
ncbi:fatty acyl-CoA reductase wat isoform X1 [Plutella xylostella]|uniref:fatty acyl-CoA reductase wat isoform X1 n=2 Tax=Plutella xylostella TaxID=51655 RepID=UPI00203290E6|nr:fatty acyl-CoA reductase wat isoform X1 [Plutella xylostella]